MRRRKFLASLAAIFGVGMSKGRADLAVGDGGFLVPQGMASEIILSLKRAESLVPITEKLLRDSEWHNFEEIVRSSPEGIPWEERYFD